MTTIAIVAASLCILNVILWVVLLSRFSRLFSTDDVVKNTNDEMSKIMTEVDNITNRNLDLIDDKIKELKEIERDAEQKIAIAKAEIVKLEIAKTTPNVMPIVNMNNIASDINHHTPYHEVENVVVPRQTNAVASKANFSSRVQDLARQGYSIAQIASELSRSTSEVSFVLEMAK